MTAWPRVGAWMLGLAGLAAAVTVGIGSRRWRSETEGLMRRLTTLARTKGGTVSFAELTGLPAPVQRYFRSVLREGQPLVRSARVWQAGEFRSEESDDVEAGWRPFEALEVFTAEPPGFAWDARIRMAPLMTVRVRDGYVGGRASMLGAVHGVVMVVRAADSPELRAGALQRYLAEAVWLPTALLPREGLSWTPIDESHARATLADGEVTVALDFEFAPTGEIVAARAAKRLRASADAEGGYVGLPWGGRYRRYDESSGMRVPLESEVYWVVDGREQPYYRGWNLRFEFDFDG